MRAAATRRPDLTIGLVTQLAGDQYVDVRAAIAGRPDLLAGLIAQLAGDQNDDKKLREGSENMQIVLPGELIRKTEKIMWNAVSRRWFLLDENLKLEWHASPLDPRRRGLIAWINCPQPGVSGNSCGFFMFSYHLPAQDVVSEFNEHNNFCLRTEGLFLAKASVQPTCFSLWDGRLDQPGQQYYVLSCRKRLLALIPQLDQQSLDLVTVNDRLALYGRLGAIQLLQPIPTL